MVIKSKDFKFSKLTMKVEDSNKKFVTARLRYDGSLPVVEVRGLFKAHFRSFSGKINCSLSMEMRDSSLDFYGLESKLKQLSAEAIGCNPKEFKLIKKDRNSDDVVYFKVLPMQDGSFPTIYDSKNECNLELSDVLFRKFYGKCPKLCI